MGNGSELRVDYDALNKVHKNLDEQKDRVKSLKLGDAPPLSAFGGSAKGEWLADAVIKGHKNIYDAKEDTIQGLEKWTSAVDDAVNNIAETDEGAAMVAKKMTEALAVMSNPLVIFSKEIGGKTPMI